MVALISAANATGEDKNAGAGFALAMAGGEPLLAHQMSALRSFGVTRFLIEVESVPGALLALADRFRGGGCTIDFVRSAADLQPLLGLNETILVQSEALYISHDLLGSLLSQPAPFIVTVDGRDDNAAFERLDLNTRWAGLAIIGASTVSSLGTLPEGWSITSSLVRQAMQDRVKFLPVPQQHIQQGALRLVNSTVDIDWLSSQILANRGRRGGGFIESTIFGPIAARLAPIIWQMSSGAVLVDVGVLVFGGISVAMAVTGWHIWAISTAIMAIFLNCTRAVVSDRNETDSMARLVDLIFWLLLAAAAILAARGDFSYSSDGTFAAVIMTGIALLAQQLTLPDWARYTLKSPALLAIAALAMTVVVGFARAAQFIALAQLGALLIAKWSHKFTGKKPKQA